MREFARRFGGRALAGCSALGEYPGALSLDHLALIRVRPDEERREPERAVLSTTAI